MENIPSNFDPEKYSKGLEAKAAANEQFKKQNYTEALRNYHKSLLYVLGLHMGGSGATSSDGIPTEDQISDIDKEASTIYSNMAACHIRLSRWNRAIECANSSLKKNPHNSKAKFRLTQGYVGEGSLEKAKNLLDELEKKSKDDAAFKLERKKIAVKEKEAELKQKKELAGMFSRR